ncbi:MAG: hypothetical protein ABFS34_11345 [Gemmatimonadota bacterium]
MIRLILEIVTHASRFVVVGGIVVLLLLRGGALDPQLRKAWIGLGIVAAFAAVTNLAIDAWVWLLDVPRGHPARVHPRELWSAMGLANSTMAAAVPAGIAFLLLRGTRVATVAVAALAVAGGLFAIGLARGAVGDYQVLLDSQRPLDLLSLALFALVVSAYLLGRLPRLGGHLAAYLAIWTAFQMLIPIVEVFYSGLGIEGASAIWTTQYVLMTSRYVAQAVVLILLMRKLGRSSQGADGTGVVLPGAGLREVFEGASG